MFKNFEIIKNSESSTGYNIPDVEFRGLKAGLLCGWQFEFKGDDGNIYYGSVSWEDCMPEAYAYRWMEGGLSWLEAYTQHNARFTGRVIFRGYAVTRWDPEERDDYVVEVEVNEDGSLTYVMLNANYQLLLKCLRGYDPFTQYIDNYKQELAAEAHNEELEKTFEHLVKDFNLDVMLPRELTNLPEEELEGKVVEWLKKHNVIVEGKRVAPKQKRVWTEEEIKSLVQTNDKVLYGALKNLYSCQTADEKSDGETSHQNGAGFNAFDAPILSSFAEFLAQAGFLTDKQKVIARKKLAKYTRQLTVLANQ